MECHNKKYIREGRIQKYIREGKIQKYIREGREEGSCSHQSSNLNGKNRLNLVAFQNEQYVFSQTPRLKN